MQVDKRRSPVGENIKPYDQFGLSSPFLCVSPQLQLLIYSPASNDALEKAGLWLFPSKLICIRLEFLLPKSTRAAATATTTMR